LRVVLNMGEWERLLKSLSEEVESAKVLELLDAIKPFANEEQVKEKVVELLLNSSDRLVRIKATEVLEELTSADGRVVDVLITSLLNDPDAFVRGFSAKVLGKLGDVRAIDFLKKAQEDEDGFVRHYASEALKVLEMKGRLLSIIQKAKGGLVSG